VSIVADAAPKWCPSGDPSHPEAVVLGVRSGEQDQLVYLDEPVPAAEVLGEIPEGIAPTRVLRFASHCVSSCGNRVGEACGLIERLKVATPPDVRAPAQAMPRCHLRPRCKWWDQAGIEACRRCPAITTLNAPENELMALAVDPATTLDQLAHWMAAEPPTRAPQP
jgi:hypothetical protein